MYFELDASVNLVIPADRKKGFRQPRSREPEKQAMDSTIAQARTHNRNLPMVPQEIYSKLVISLFSFSRWLNSVRTRSFLFQAVHYNLRTRCDMTKGKVKEEVLKMGGLGRIPVPNLNLEDMTVSISNVTFIIKFLPSVAK